MEYINSTFTDIESMIDLGCGDGKASKTYGEKFGYEYYGFDGDWIRLPKNENYVLHDFSQGLVEFDPEDTSFDLAYSVEFLEHVDEEYQDNYMNLISRCRYAVVTAAPPGTPGRHHVNCRTQEYWVEVFAKYGFTFLPEITKTAREKSLNRCNQGNEKNQFFKLSGMVFKK